MLEQGACIDVTRDLAKPVNVLMLRQPCRTERMSCAVFNPPDPGRLNQRGTLSSLGRLAEREHPPGHLHARRPEPFDTVLRTPARTGADWSSTVQRTPRSPD